MLFSVETNEIRESGWLKKAFRAPEIPSRRGRRNENTWREGKRQNTPRPPTRIYGRPLENACTLTTKIPMEQPMTGMTCTRCRTEDPSPVFVSPLGTTVSPPLSFFDLPRNRGLCRTGYLLRGRCRLNLINSMRHLDKCAHPKNNFHTHPPSFPFFQPPLPLSLSSPLFFLNCPILSGRSNRFFGYQIPDSYSSSASELQARGREKERESGDHHGGR